MNPRKIAATAFVIALMAGGSPASAAGGTSSPLPSWRETAMKAAILGFVERVTKPGDAACVPPTEQIAVFDNDGTLWAESPIYVAFALDRVKVLAPEHSEWKDKEPFRSVLAGDLKAALSGGEHAIAERAMATHAGMTTGEFAAIADGRALVVRRRHEGRLGHGVPRRPCRGPLSGRGSGVSRASSPTALVRAA